MFYMLVGISIMLLIYKKISGESWAEIFKPDDKDTYIIILIPGIVLSIITFAVFGSLFGMNKPSYIKTDTVIYKLMEYEDRNYFIKNDWNIILDKIKVRFIKDDFLEEEEFDSNIVKIKLFDNKNEQATIKVTFMMMNKHIL